MMSRDPDVGPAFIVLLIIMAIAIGFVLLLDKLGWA